MAVLLMVMAICRCRAVIRGFVATRVAASMLERSTLAHRDRQRTVNRNGHGDHEQQQESSKCLHCRAIVPQVRNFDQRPGSQFIPESTSGPRVNGLAKIYQCSPMFTNVRAISPFVAAD